MNEMTRRDFLQDAAGAGLVAQAADKSPVGKPMKQDRDFVLAAGMTPEEADCWEVVAEAAGKFFALPKMHPMDAQEVASAIHIIQNKLLSRPTYRRYLEEARKGLKKG